MDVTRITQGEKGGEWQDKESKIPRYPYSIQPGGGAETQLILSVREKYIKSYLCRVEQSAAGLVARWWVVWL